MLPEKPITRREMYLDYIARNGTIGGGITVDEEPTQGSYHATGSGGLYDALEGLREDINALRVEVDSKVYGVAGVGQEASALTRTHDAVGMVAQVGTDGDNSGVRNDFDSAGPWMRRKCVGRWVDGGDRARFVVSAYLGDPWYTEDGSIGDYVAVECPRCYYRFNHETGALDITAIPMQGFRAFDIFCHNHNQAETMPVYYAPAYSLVTKDGEAVCLPGIDPFQGNYQLALETARTYAGGSVGNNVILMPFAYAFYEWALFTVEFATQDCQSIMCGPVNFRGNNSGTCKFIDSTHVIINKYSPLRETVGSYIAISLQTYTHISTFATHKVLSIAACNEDGSLNESGNYLLIEVMDLGKGYYSYDTTTTYNYAARNYRTGSSNTVGTPSGSTADNLDGLHPFRYRWHENPYGGQYHTIMDLFGWRNGTDSTDYYIKWYYLLKPGEYIPINNDSPKAEELSSSQFEELDIITPHDSYKDGLNRKKTYSQKYPDVWVSDGNNNASQHTYTCDQHYLVNDVGIRAVRIGGFWGNSLNAGFSFLFANNSPRTATATTSADLFFAQ